MPVAEFSHPDFPGECLVLCTARQYPLDGTRATANGKRDHAKTAERLGMGIDRFRMAKRFFIKHGDGKFSFRREEEKIDAEIKLGGYLVLRTSLKNKDLGTHGVVSSCKRLSKVGRAFRRLRPGFYQWPERNWTEPRVRAHVLLHMLAYLLEWHLRRAWSTLLLDDDPDGPGSWRAMPTDSAGVSDSASGNNAKRVSMDGHKVSSYEDLMDIMSGVSQVKVTHSGHTILLEGLTEATPLQDEAKRLVEAYQR